MHTPACMHGRECKRSLQSGNCMVRVDCWRKHLLPYASKLTHPLPMKPTSSGSALHIGWKSAPNAQQPPPWGRSMSCAAAGLSWWAFSCIPPFYLRETRLHAGLYWETPLDQYALPSQKRPVYLFPRYHQPSQLVRHATIGGTMFLWWSNIIEIKSIEQYGKKTINSKNFIF